MIITDDGSSTAPWSTGLGLASIQTRASEVGGACEAGPRPRAVGWSPSCRWEPVDDQGAGGRRSPGGRDGLRALFAEYPDIDLIGEAATGREAIKAVIDKPDVIIMDLAMPDTDGFSAPRRSAGWRPTWRCSF